MTDRTPREALDAALSAFESVSSDDLGAERREVVRAFTTYRDETERELREARELLEWIAPWKWGRHCCCGHPMASGHTDECDAVHAYLSRKSDRGEE